MSKRKVEFFYIDLFIAIDKIKRYTQQFEDGESLLYDELSWDATLREFEIIGEAAKYLIKENFLDESFRSVVDFRNIVAHEYFGINAEEVFFIIKEKLPKFEKELYLLIDKFDKEILLSVILSAKKDFNKFPHTIQLLKNIEEQI